MASVTEPLRAEHRVLRPEIERLRLAAAAVGQASPERAREAVDAAYAFLVEHLIPHATAEDQALYPVVDQALGTPRATASMSRDHVEVGRLTEELARLRAAPWPEAAEELRRVLYGLYALVTVHFAKEEEVYLPLLEARLTATQAHALFERMEAAAGEARLALAG